MPRNLLLEEYKAALVPAEIEVPHRATKLVKESGSLSAKSKHQNDKVGLQSMEMLKVRVALEEKLKQKGVFSSVTPKHQSAKRNAQPLNGCKRPGKGKRTCTVVTLSYNVQDCNKSEKDKGMES